MFKTIERPIMILGFAVVLVLPLIAVPQTADDPEPRARISRYEAERLVSRLENRRTEIENELDVLDRVSDGVTRARSYLDRASVEPSASQRIQEVQSTFAALVALPGSAQLNTGFGELGALLEAVQELQRSLSSTVEDVAAEFDAVARSYRYGSEEYDLATSLLPDFYELQRIGWMDSLGEIAYSIAPGQTLTRQSLATVLDGVRSDIDDFDMTDYREIFESLNAEAEDRLDAVSTRIGDQRRRLDTELDNVLNQIDATAEQLSETAVIDQNLTYSIWGMIIVLAILFLSLRIFSAEVAKELIGKRSLVEVLSMAFMLLTIIILGTGERITGETLGTLLGMIAGYIFGRRSGPPAPGQQ